MDLFYKAGPGAYTNCCQGEETLPPGTQTSWNTFLSISSTPGYSKLFLSCLGLLLMKILLSMKPVLRIQIQLLAFYKIRLRIRILIIKETSIEIRIAAAPSMNMFGPPLLTKILSTRLLLIVFIGSLLQRI